MTMKKDLYVWQVKAGARRPRKVKLNRLLKAVNNNSFSSQFFPNEKDAKKYIGRR